MFRRRSLVDDQDPVPKFDRWKYIGVERLAFFVLLTGDPFRIRVGQLFNIVAQLYDLRTLVFNKRTMTKCAVVLIVACHVLLVQRHV